MSNHIPDEWSEPDASRGVELSIEESIALWHFMQREDVPPYWNDALIASLTNKLKTFHKYGPWESGEQNQEPDPASVRCGDLRSFGDVGPITCQRVQGHEGEHAAWARPDDPMSEKRTWESSPASEPKGGS